MKKMTSIVLALGAAVLTPAFGTPPLTPAPFAMPDTQVIPFTSKDGSHAFKLFIGLPRNYATRTERFPVIYLLDANFSFPLADEILRHTADRGQGRESIVVGIAYPGAETDIKIYERTRMQDYTPTYSPTGGYGPETQVASGGGPMFLNILSDELLPFIDSHFRTNPAIRTIVGHSAGGLFATYAMLTKPGLFSDYLVVSPSLWYDNRVMFGVAKDFIAENSSLHANVFYAVGAFEEGTQHAMVSDLKDWNALFDSAKLQGYSAKLMVFDGDTHEAVFPAALTRGLRVLSNFAGEANGNKLENAGNSPAKN